MCVFTDSDENMTDFLKTLMNQCSALTTLNQHSIQTTQHLTSLLQGMMPECAPKFPPARLQTQTEPTPAEEKTAQIVSKRKRNEKASRTSRRRVSKTSEETDRRQAAKVAKEAECIGRTLGHIIESDWWKYSSSLLEEVSSAQGWMRKIDSSIPVHIPETNVIGRGAFYCAYTGEGYDTKTDTFVPMRLYLCTACPNCYFRSYNIARFRDHVHRVHHIHQCRCMRFTYSDKSTLSKQSLSEHIAENHNGNRPKYVDWDDFETLASFAHIPERHVGPDGTSLPHLHKCTCYFCRKPQRIPKK